VKGIKMTDTPPVDPPQPDPNSPDVQPNPEDPVRLSGYDIALEVIDGKWGTGQDRRNRLHDAGYDYREIDEEIRLIRNPQ
jgi:hypothetical protein